MDKINKTPDSINSIQDSINNIQEIVYLYHKYNLSTISSI